MRRDLTTQKERAINAWQIEEIYELELELKEIIGQLHIDLSSTTLSWAKSEIKADLSVATTLLDICRERKVVVNNSTFRMDRKFREVARKMLLKPVYDAIHKESIKPRVFVVDETQSQIKAEYLDIVVTASSLQENEQS
jgi:hypothetical protein